MGEGLSWDGGGRGVIVGRWERGYHDNRGSCEGAYCWLFVTCTHEPYAHALSSVPPGEMQDIYSNTGGREGGREVKHGEGR